MVKSRVEKKREKLPDIIPMECPRCGHKWEYKGKNPFFAQCPACYKQRIKIEENRRDIENIDADKKKLNLIEELKKMEFGDTFYIERYEDHDIRIDKQKMLGRNSGGIFPNMKIYYIISEELPAGFRGKPISLLESDLEKLHKEAEEKNKTLTEQIVKMIDMKESNIEKLKSWLIRIKSDSKSLEDYKEA